MTNIRTLFGIGHRTLRGATITAIRFEQARKHWLPRAGYFINKLGRCVSRLA
jgi:hypothetical protein